MSNTRGNSVEVVAQLSATHTCGNLGYEIHSRRTSSEPFAFAAVAIDLPPPPAAFVEDPLDCVLVVFSDLPRVFIREAVREQNVLSACEEFIVKVSPRSF